MKFIILAIFAIALVSSKQIILDQAPPGPGGQGPNQQQQQQQEQGFVNCMQANCSSQLTDCEAD